VLAGELASVMRLPAPALVLITLLFPALLAWSAAAVACRAAGLFGSRTGGPR
jgi:hypothetical protein